MQYATKGDLYNVLLAWHRSWKRRKLEEIFIPNRRFGKCPDNFLMLWIIYIRITLFIEMLKLLTFLWIIKESYM